MSNKIESHNDEIISKERRDAMKKLGKYGVYTAPAIITLLSASKAPAASGAPATPPSTFQ